MELTTDTKQHIIYVCGVVCMYALLGCIKQHSIASVAMIKQHITVSVAGY